MNLGVGAYRDNNNKPFVLPSVREAEEAITLRNEPKEYLGITGDPTFNHLAAVLAYGASSRVIQNSLLASTQSISGTGALRIGGAFLARFFQGTGGKKIYLPTPTYCRLI
jgi:aspartate aminotransferase